jgi:hypothetical protein
MASAPGGRDAAAEAALLGAAPGRVYHGRRAGRVGRSNEPTAYRESIAGDGVRLKVAVVIVAAGLVVGAGIVPNLIEGEASHSPPALPTSSTPVAAATTRPTPRPRPTPSPAPTLPPTAAPAAEADPAPTGVVVADTGEVAVGDLVPDANGTVWATRAGGVINVDPRSGRAREWTLADDPAFATSFIAPARSSGVWLVGPRALRRFDGERFSAVIDVPDPIWSMAEGPDGSLWAQTERYGLIHWADGIWTSDPAGRPVRGASDIVIDAGGRVWTIDGDEADGPGGAGQSVSTWDGSRWTTYARAELPDLAWDSISLFASADGSIWAAAGSRLARYGPSGWTHDEYRTGSWTSYEVPGLGGEMRLSAVDEAGRLWFTEEGCDSCGVRIMAYDGSVLTTYDADDGLPGPKRGDTGWAAVVTGPGPTLASTNDGLYRLSDGSWQSVELTGASGSPAQSSIRLARVTSIAAPSRDEVWATDAIDDPASGMPTGSRLLHFDGTAWQQQPLPVEAVVGKAVLAPDDALWVATSSGPLVLRDGRWTDLGEVVAGVVPEPGGPDAGCGGAVFIGADGVIRYAGPRSGNRVVALLPHEGSWTARADPEPAPGAGCMELDTLAATADGTIWVLARGWGNVLSRSAGASWENVLPADSARIPLDLPGGQVDPAAIAVDRDGSLIVAVAVYREPPDDSWVDIIQLVDGQWVRRLEGDSGGFISALAPLSDGSLIAIGDGVARFDGAGLHWSWPGTWFNALSVAPDGAVWVAGQNIYRLPLSSD